MRVMQNLSVNTNLTGQLRSRNWP